MKVLITVLASLIFVVGCASSSSTPEAAKTSTSADHESEWRIPATDSFVIHSAAAQRDFQITVAVPRGYKESSSKYPVLYVLDANWAFPVAVEMARILAIGPKENPTGDLKEQPVIVGIGYPVGLYWNAIPARLKDFTPVSNPALVGEVANAIGFSPDTSGSGGAEQFLAFLAKEMMPAVEGRYRIDERRRALFGHSLGGLFAVYVLFHQTELFNGYLIGSPALDLDHDFTWSSEQAFARDHKDLRARVFLSSGSLDEQYTAMVRKLDEVLRLRQYDGLTWHTEIFAGETHSSVGALSLTRGIRWLYGDLAPKS